MQRFVVNLLYEHERQLLLIKTKFISNIIIVADWNCCRQPLPPTLAANLSPAVQLKKDYGCFESGTSQQRLEMNSDSSRTSKVELTLKALSLFPKWDHCSDHCKPRELEPEFRFCCMTLCRNNLTLN